MRIHLLICLTLFCTGCFSISPKDGVLLETESPKLQEPVPPAQEQVKPAEAKETSFRALKGNVMPGAQPLLLNSDLHLSFSQEIEKKSLADAAFVVTCNGNEKEPLPGVVTLRGRDFFFRFERRFFVHSNKDPDGMAWSGLKPSSSCQLSIHESVRSKSGAVLAPESRHFAFSTVKNDFGIYWFGDDGTYEKAVPGVASSLYDPTKPILFFVHGWANTTTQRGFFRENPFVFQNPNYGAQNLLPLWKKRGYNVAIFYWPQLADEPEVLDAEAKVWQGNSNQKGANGLPVRMRFRASNNTWDNSFATEKSVSELLLAEYTRTLSGFRGPAIRLVAHSLGSQVGINFLHLLSEQVITKKISAKLFPSRVVLLDPFWSKGGRAYLGNRWTGEVCREYMKAIIAKHDVAFEYIKTSLVGSRLSGDRNLDLRAQAVYYRVRPEFIPILDQKSMHWYAYVWYFGSIAHSFSTDAKIGFGAAASDSDIRARMKSQRAKPVTLWQVGGIKTPRVSDDAFEEQTGVDGE